MTSIQTLFQRLFATADIIYECRNCGQTVESDDDYCPNCGAEEISVYRVN